MEQSILQRLASSAELRRKDGELKQSNAGGGRAATTSFSRNVEIKVWIYIKYGKPAFNNQLPGHIV
jgi:hypothetical protein